MKNNKVVITNAIWSKLKRSTMKPSKQKISYDRTKWDMIFGKLMKLKKLATAIEMQKGPEMNIDDSDYRWVQDRIEYMENGSYIFTKENMEQANELWRIYR